MSIQLWFLLLFFLLFHLLLHPCLPLSSAHPLDPLTAAEISTIRRVIQSSHLGASKSLAFHYVGLDEPDKTDVQAWAQSATRGRRQRRRAFVVARSGGETHEIVVDVADASVVSDRVYRGSGYPIQTLDELEAAAALPLNYTPFVESARRRGVALSDVVCSPLTAGWFGEPGRGRRRLKLQCCVAGETANFYMRPMEGITVVVDLDEMRIIGYRDRVVVPVPKAEGTDYRAAKQRPPFALETKPGVVVQPAGKGFRIDGHVISSGFGVRSMVELGLPPELRCPGWPRYLPRVSLRRPEGRSPAGAVPGLRLGSLRAVHGSSGRVVLQDLLRRRRVRVRPVGVAARADDRLPRQRRVHGRLLRHAGWGARQASQRVLCLRALQRRCCLAAHGVGNSGTNDQGGPARGEPGGEDGRRARQLRLCHRLGVQDQWIHQSRGLPNRHTGGEGHALHPHGPDHHRRAWLSASREHHRRLPRPFRHLLPRPRHRWPQQHLHQIQAQDSEGCRRRRRPPQELLDGDQGGGQDGGGRSRGDRVGARRVADCEPKQEDQDGESRRLSAHHQWRARRLVALRRRLPPDASQLREEAGVGDSIQQVGEVGSWALRRQQQRRRQLSCLESKINYFLSVKLF
ncbi:uncharacterized protein LOC135618635 isoform X3 [Musa acuminata AAA Group]|uniref:uncharacterized protein LOC135618635 isoform X3 n=1 Tax=Musa acuminata AAA Group TaxID=214697 RepID=UPI0031D1BBC8